MMIAQAELTQLQSMLSNFGFPITLIVVVVIFAWRAAKYWTPIIKDWGERFIHSHEKMGESAIEIGRTNSKTLETISSSMQGINDTINRIENTQEELRKTQLDLHKQNHEGK